ncbi:MAG TPA: glycoside hydrolase family 88 protein [Usitatibacter sp.]|nr:glycoside hydrolase family 88 protein [Usitatibacter sp.]
MNASVAFDAVRANADERIRDVTAKVAAFTIGLDNKGYKNWEFAPVINGLIALGEDEHLRAARRIVDLGVALQNSEGQLAFGLNIVQGEAGNAVERWTGAKTITGTVHSSSYGPGTLYFHRRLDDPRYLDAARRQYEYVKTVRRSRDGGIVHREETTELWVDTVYFTVPFLAQYAMAAGSPEAADEARRQIRVHTERLRDARTGLFRHIWCETPDHFPQSTFWSRGQGWIAASLVDAFEAFPAGHEGRGEAAAILERMAGALLERQDASGFWHNVIDDPRAALEASGTALCVYSLRKALDLGMLEGEGYAQSARRGMLALLEAVRDDGAVGMVSLPPGGPNAKYGWAPYGQGAFLLAASRYR